MVCTKNEITKKDDLENEFLIAEEKYHNEI